MSRRSMPIFPLHSVLLPGGPMALRIFEPRYLDMVSRCLRDESGFGVALIREGQEVGPAAEVYGVGTLVGISYWEQRKDGLLGITVRGEQRFKILDSEVQENQLRIAEVELLPEEEELPLPGEYRHMVLMLQRILDDLSHPYITLPRRYDDAAWVAGRLIELLPLELALKQRLLQMDGPLQRLEMISGLLISDSGD
jgi:uncharacterized protein